ncbi:MAG: hypothetical protein M3246_01885, partial [Actinomycetota bacterium]|nr:hypothetical protein [Actinomycetota bacterium]
ASLEQVVGLLLVGHVAGNGDGFAPLAFTRPTGRLHAAAGKRTSSSPLQLGGLLNDRSDCVHLLGLDATVLGNL